MKHTWTQKTAGMAPALIILAALILGCSPKPPAQTEQVVKIGLVGEELQAPWTRVAENLAPEGIKLELIYFSDYAVPNRALADGEIDLNAFQHDAFLQDEIANNGYQIGSFGNTVVFFLGVYSSKITNLGELKNGDTVVIMNDATNGGRALKVLESAGVFTVDPARGNVPTVADITVNPKNIKIVEVDAANTYRTLDDPEVSAAVVNSTYVINAGGIPDQDAIYIKPVDSVSDKPYINIVVGRTADRDNELLKKVVAAFQTDEIAEVIRNEPALLGAFPAW